MSIKSKEAFNELFTKPDDVTEAIQQAVREALIEHHKAGQKVVTWRDGQVVWVDVDENGEYVDSE